MSHVILHEYHAYHHSGNRTYAAIDWIVLHDMESANYLRAAENCGTWFESARSGGSTHYGCDDDSIQQYLSMLTVAWGAPGANDNGVHIEQMGMASWSKTKWLQHKGTLDNCAWLIAHIHGKVGVPIRRLTGAEIRAHKRGVVTHRQLTAAIGGTHTDPGPGYPMDWVMDRARKYAT